MGHRAERAWGMGHGAERAERALGMGPKGPKGHWIFKISN